MSMASWCCMGRPTDRPAKGCCASRLPEAERRSIRAWNGFEPDSWRLPPDRKAPSAVATINKLELPMLAGTPSIDLSCLYAFLSSRIEGEVRLDRVSRALYSTDASVYQIVPLGVVLPKSEADVVATVQACSRFGVPITARGGGTSQAGQAIGPGIILDFSKHFNRIVEINPDERWARVQPGCVLDDLNHAIKPHALHFAPDISTSNRATIGGMVANNASGTHSIIHGKTIDHVLGLKVLLADGSIVHTAPMSEDETKAKSVQQDLEGACYRVVRKLAQEHASEIERRYPKILRRVGGYNLDRFVDGDMARTRNASDRFDLTPI